MDNSSVENFTLVHDPLTASYDHCSTLPTANGEIPVRFKFSKSQVYIHPSTCSKDHIHGSLYLAETLEPSSSKYIVAWLPSDEASNAYEMWAPITDILSLKINPPSMTTWLGNIIINFRDGHSHAPLWFHDSESSSTVLQSKTQGGYYNGQKDCRPLWGGDEFIDQLSQLIAVERVGRDKDHIYLVGKQPTGLNLPSSSRGGPASAFESAQMNQSMAMLKEAQWNILGKFALVTKFCRDVSAEIFQHPASAPFRPLLPLSLQEMYNQETVRKTMDDYDSARIFLAKWAAGIAAQSEQSLSDDKRYRHVGIWGNDGLEEMTTLGAFEILNSENDHSIATHTRTDPITSQEWNSFFDRDGKFIVSDATVKSRVFAAGLEHGLRKEAWLFLAGVYPWKSNREERETLKNEKRKAYQSLKAQWKENEERRATPEFEDQKNRIDKDVHRTDRTVPQYAEEDMPNPDSSISMYQSTNQNMETLKDILCTYNVYNTELGYVQGMSDLLSPLNIVIDDEALVFWAFASFMERMKPNFYMDQSGMLRQLSTMDALLQFMDPSLYKHFHRTDSQNLFFCFRWLLVWFKREFSWEDTLTLWEVLWTDRFTDQFHMFVALAILDQHRDSIINHLKTFDEILKYINDLAMNLDLQDILQRAEILFHQFKQRVDTVVSKRTRLETVVSDRLSDKETREDAKNDLQKLPNINNQLRSLLPNQ